MNGSYKNIAWFRVNIGSYPLPPDTESDVQPFFSIYIGTLSKSKED